MTLYTEFYRCHIQMKSAVTHDAHYQLTPTSSQVSCAVIV